MSLTDPSQEALIASLVNCEEQVIMARLSIPLCVFFVTSFSGCENETPKDPLKTNVDKPEPLIDVESISPGPRPSYIDGARFLKASDFLELNLDEHVEENVKREDRPWFAVEGIVEQSFKVLGADGVNLRCDNCSKMIYSEGNYGRYRLEPGQNIVIMGQLFNGRSLGRGKLVTQAQIDDAIRKEQAEEQPKPK